MLKADSQTVSILQADMMAVNALFKRIAERGRRIRTQNTLPNSEIPNLETLSTGQARAHHKEPAKMGKVER